MTILAPESASRLSGFEARYQQMQRAKLLWTGLYAVLFIGALLGSMLISDFDPVKLFNGLPKAWNYIYGTFPHIGLDTFASDMSNWFWGLRYWLSLLIETVLMGFVGTVLGGIFALLLCFPASRNVNSNWPLYFVSRRLLEFFRTVPELVFALIFVYAFGLGPFAGVLAIAVHTVGSLGKLFAEVNDNIDLRPVDGVRAAGGNWPMVIRLAVIPQALPNYASYLLLRLEVNVRGAGALGFVGAGGLGQDLYVAIRQFEYTDISAIMLLLISMVAIIDITCETIRHRLIGADVVKGN